MSDKYILDGKRAVECHDLMAWATRNAIEQLLRYGGGPWSSELIDVLEKLADINDDLQHARASDLVRAKIAEAKALLDRLASVECP